MPDVGRVLFWDFDGTLAHREGLWAGCLVEILDQHDPGHGRTIEQFRPLLDRDFPWLHPDRPHPFPRDADGWWARLDDVLTCAFRSVGYHAEAATLARRVRTQFAAPDRWQRFEDTMPVLAALTDAGWRHVVVSNHVPELADIVDGLGISPFLDAIVNSAEVGYEKPHPAIFAHAREVAGDPRTCWMIGDSPTADVAGAEAVGIPSILVRRDGDAPRRCPDLTGVASLLA